MKKHNSIASKLARNTLVERIDSATQLTASELSVISDMDYLDALGEAIENLQTAAEAKREEMNG